MANGNKTSNVIFNNHTKYIIILGGDWQKTQKKNKVGQNFMPEQRQMIFEGSLKVKDLDS